ncbi:MAG: CYTH domain-containing protein [Eubacteriales bacterium]|nr:CYTH domain-containing protein [Eubacteriales bacterium]
MGREFELKYRADEAAFRGILDFFGGFTPISMETAYYDTPGRALRARKWMLRLRLENGVSVCTLKTPLPDGSRGEWEVKADTIAQGVSELCKLDVPDGLAELTAGGLVQACAARFTRLAAVIALADCTLELALDRGVFLAPGREAPFAEVEVEGKSGSEASVRAFAEQLARDFRLTPEKKSKAHRAFALADHV